MIQALLQRLTKATNTPSNATLSKLHGQLTRRLATSTSSTAPESYSASAKLMHWGMASGILSCFALVQAKNYTDDKKMKAPKLPEGNALEHGLANISHLTLYGLMAFMPLSGIAMGYFGGKGLPFFFTTIPGATKEQKNPKIAKNAYKYHKQFGQFFEYIFVPLHIGAVGFHFLRGQNILTRINPFVK